MVSAYEEPIEWLDFIKNFLDIDIKQVIYKDEKSLYEAIEEGANQGFEIAIGGKATKRAAIANNMIYCDWVTTENEIIEHDSKCQVRGAFRKKGKGNIKRISNHN